MFIQDTVVSELVVMSSLCFGEGHSGLVLFFALSFVWGGAVLMNIFDALVATVGYGNGVFFEMKLGVFK